MKRNLQINKRWMHALLLLVASFALLSCGGYYYADGVYYDPVPERPSYLEIVEELAYTPVENRYTPNRYKDYFGEKAQQYRQMPDTSVTHFTDVNSYRSNATSGAPAYGGWGSNPSQVNVNVYNNNPWGYNSWGYNNWYPNYYGYDSYYRNRARWSLSFGWGWGSYYDPYWGYNGYYGYRPYYGGYYDYYPYYGYSPYYGYNPYYGYYPYGGYYPYYGYYPYGGGYYYPYHRDNYYYERGRRDDGYRRSYTNERYGNPGRTYDYNSNPSYQGRSNNNYNNNSYSRPYDEGRYRRESQSSQSSGRYSQPQYDNSRSYDSGRYQRESSNYGNSNSNSSSSSSSGRVNTTRDY